LRRAGHTSILDVMRVLLVSVLAMSGCVEPAADVELDPSEPEISGEQVDPEHGFCRGVTDPNPTWASCSEARCELDITQCFATAGCRAVYADDLRTQPDDRIFRECVPVAPSLSPGPCEALDALGCSRREDCVAVHSGLFIHTPFRVCEREDLYSGAVARNTSSSLFPLSVFH
jgi:hypothetical protein